MESSFDDSSNPKELIGDENWIKNACSVLNSHDFMSFYALNRSNLKAVQEIAESFLEVLRVTQILLFSTKMDSVKTDIWCWRLLSSNFLQFSLLVAIIKHVT